MAVSLLDLPQELLLHIVQMLHEDSEIEPILALAETSQWFFYTLKDSYNKRHTIWQPYPIEYEQPYDQKPHEGTCRRRERILALMACPAMIERIKSVELLPVLHPREKEQSPEGSIHKAKDYRYAPDYKKGDLYEHRWSYLHPFRQPCDEIVEEERVSELESEIMLWQQAVQMNTCPAFDRKTHKRSMDTAIFLLTCTSVENLTLTCQRFGPSEFEYFYTPFRYALSHPGCLAKLKRVELHCSKYLHFERIRPIFALPKLVELNIHGLQAYEEEDMQNLQPSKLEKLCIKSCLLTQTAWKSLFQHLPKLHSFDWSCGSAPPFTWLTSWREELSECCHSTLTALILHDSHDQPLWHFKDLSMLEFLRIHAVHLYYLTSKLKLKPWQLLPRSLKFLQLILKDDIQSRFGKTQLPLMAAEIVWHAAESLPHLKQITLVLSSTDEDRERIQVLKKACEDNGILLSLQVIESHSAGE